jgi:hypothetical protein
VIRKTLGGLFALLGACFCAVSILALVRLSAVTAWFVEASGDPEFKSDSGFFMFWIALAALLLGAFGLALLACWEYSAPGRAGHRRGFVFSRK